MIYIECKPDKMLAKSLGFSKKDIIHSGGISEVCKRLTMQKNCIGLIDEDPDSNQPPYLKRLHVQDNLLKYDIKILNDNSNNNLVIRLCPRLEEWILKAASDARINPKNYSLPDDGNELHKFINSNVKKFEKFLDELNENSVRLKTLKDLLRSHPP